MPGDPPGIMGLIDAVHQCLAAFQVCHWNPGLAPAILPSYCESRSPDIGWPVRRVGSCRNRMSHGCTGIHGASVVI